jgi:predicted transcriptional regulator
MNVIWDRGTATVAEVWKDLAVRRKVARNTVQTTIARLEERGWLRRHGDGPALRYSASRPRSATQRGLVRRLVDSAFGGSVEGLVAALLEGHRLSHDEAERLRALIDRSGRAEDRA